MEFRKKSPIALIIMILSISFCYAGNVSVVDNITGKIVNETVQNIQNKTISIFKQVKAIKYDYRLFDKNDYGKIYRATNDIDVKIVSKHKNSSIALAYFDRCFIVYDEIYLTVYNKNNQNLTLCVYFDNDTVEKYNISGNYEMFKFVLSDELNKIRFQLLDGNNTIFDTGPLTVIHKNYIQWYEDQKKEYMKVEKSEMILSDFWYFLTGGILVLILGIFWARREKRRKENEIIAGWQ